MSWGSVATWKSPDRKGVGLRARTAFGADVMQLTADPLLAAMVALPLVLIRSKVHAALVMVNLWLFMELRPRCSTRTTLWRPAVRRFGASACKSRSPMARCCSGAIGRSGTERVTVH